MIRELTVQIENEPGRVLAVAHALGTADIDIAALSIADRETSGALRMVVRNLPAAREVLMGLDLPITVQRVVAVHTRDTPGGLAAVLEPLQRAGVDIRYLYAFREPQTSEAMVILHSDDNAKVEALLTDAGFTLGDESMDALGAGRG